MECSVCGEPIPSHVRNCVACQSDVGFPNVRAADLKDETEALKLRLKVAIESARARGSENNLRSFGSAVLKSRAIMCRSLAQVRELIENDNSLLPTFHQQVSANARIPNDNKWDKGRGAVDSTLFPNYPKDIHFADLTLNNRGLTSYGPIAIVFKEPMIVHRSTVFEENPFSFCTKHNVVAGSPIPRGYRATWGNRQSLAMAKLHSEISSSTQQDEFPAILIKDAQSGDDDDFIEVHIYGTINRSAIELVAYKKPNNRPDIILVSSLKIHLNKLGIPFEEY